MKKLGYELKQGDVIKTWFGNHVISEIIEYDSPIIGECKIVRFSTWKTGMSIELHLLYEIIGC